MPKPRVSNPRNDARHATCIRAYKYVCAGCGKSVYLDGGDLRLNDAQMRRMHRWSLNTEVGWLCATCAVGGSPFARLGPRPGRRRMARALTSKAAKQRLLPLAARVALDAYDHYE